MNISLQILFLLTSNNCNIIKLDVSQLLKFYQNVLIDCIFSNINIITKFNNPLKEIFNYNEYHLLNKIHIKYYLN